MNIIWNCKLNITKSIIFCFFAFRFFDSGEKAYICFP